MMLSIDEVDKSSNNQLFLDFLGMLRKKYLRRDAGREESFHSVILAGVHDVKTLKANRTGGHERVVGPGIDAIRAIRVIRGRFRRPVSETTKTVRTRNNFKNVTIVNEIVR